jgi:hypothetical protein
VICPRALGGPRPSTRLLLDPGRSISGRVLADGEDGQRKAVAGPRPLNAAWRLVFRLGSRWPASGGGCGARGLKAPWLPSLSIELFCSCVPRISRVEFPGRRCQTRRDARRGGATGVGRRDRSCCAAAAGEATGIGMGGDTGYTSLNCDSTGRPSCSSTTARSSARGLHRQRSCAASQ